MDESITVERVRHALVVGRLDADGAAVRLAANLPPKRNRTCVVVGSSAREAMTRLDPWLTADLADEAPGDLCVVAPGFGSMGDDGALPPAKLLAERLGVEVTAPDGDPVALADGTLFAPAGWVSFRPDGRRTRAGARFPAPWWQDGLPDPTDHLVHIPAGLWLRRPDAQPRTGDRLLQQVPDRDRMYLVLGAPGEPPPEAPAVVEVLRQLPDEGRDRAVLACYGFGGDALAREVAGALGAPVRVAHGIPGDDGLVQVDGTGATSWRPFAVESVYRSDGPPVLDRWVAPGSLAMVEPGSYRLTEGWRVDVVPRGLVVRPESAQLDEPTAAEETGPTADVVFVAEDPVPPEVLTAFNRLVRELPDAVGENLRITPVGEPSALEGIEAADRIVRAPVRTAPRGAGRAPVPPPRGAVKVMPDGRVLPVAPILAVPGPTTPDGTVVLTDDARAEPEDSGIPSVAGTSVAPALPAPTRQVPSSQPLPAPPMSPAGPRPPAPTWQIPPAQQAVPPQAPAAPAAPRPHGPAPQRPAPSPTPVPQVPAAPPGPTPTAAAALQGPASPPASAPMPPATAAQAGPVQQVAAPQAPLWGHPRSAPSGGQPPWIGQLDAKSTASPRNGAAPVRQVEVTAPMPAVPSTAAPAGESTPADARPKSSGPAEMAKPGNFRALGSASAVAPASGSSMRAPEQARTRTEAETEPEGGDTAEEAEPAPVAALPATVASSAVASNQSTVEADSVADLLPKRDAPQPVEVPEDARSTAAQRRAMRAALGSRYDVATRAVTRMLSERPGMRFSAEDQAALLAELAVVRVFADEPTGEYDTDFYVCLADGLRRLPTVRTVVVRGIPAGTAVQPEAVIRLPAPVVAAPATGSEPVGPAEALIWTTTGRRLDGLLDEHRDDVVLSGHTRLRVLAVESEPVQRVLLAEDGAARDAALTRLRAAAAARAEVPARQTTTGRWFGPLPAA
ncbi:hypothetical protein ABT337_30035 [Saccharopolyspora hirsuta]|uniref:hypothetical protein n=1 Tax=Saccharopolyspora hirsuta TaxID=1837 RepID=UPI00332A1A1A